MKQAYLLIAAIIAFGTFATQSSAQNASADLAKEILNSCVITYAEVGSCTVTNWPKIQDRCNFAAHPKLKASSVLQNGIASGQCTAEGFSGLATSVLKDLYPN